MDTITGALTYDGSVLDTVLNTVVLVVAIVALVAQGRSPWWVVLVVITVLQVVLWFALGVVGFSLIWSALAGAAVVELVGRRRMPGNRWALGVAAVAALVLIVYYAVTLPAITTVAHLLAVLVGIGVHALVRRTGRAGRARPAVPDR